MNPVIHDWSRYYMFVPRALADEHTHRDLKVTTRVLSERLP